ncbi:MAG: GYF domain-containing protein [Chthoniobacteraceae bacterium]
MNITPGSENPLARWYYAVGEHSVAGPVTIEALHFLLLKGEITFETPVLPERGGGPWQPCRIVFTGEK